MILNYYQAVELMSSLPTLLVNGVEEKEVNANQQHINETYDLSPEPGTVLEMWNYDPQLLQANGSAFY